MTTNELLDLYSVSSKEEQKELAEELFKRLDHLSRMNRYGFNSYNHVINA